MSSFSNTENEDLSEQPSKCVMENWAQIKEIPTFRSLYSF